MAQQESTRTAASIEKSRRSLSALRPTCSIPFSLLAQPNELWKRPKDLLLKEGRDSYRTEQMFLWTERNYKQSNRRNGRERREERTNSQALIKRTFTLSEQRAKSFDFCISNCLFVRETSELQLLGNRKVLNCKSFLQKTPEHRNCLSNTGMFGDSNV